jgi:hypothetical protein
VRQRFIVVCPEKWDYAEDRSSSSAQKEILIQLGILFLVCIKTHQKEFIRNRKDQTMFGKERDSIISNDFNFHR